MLVGLLKSAFADAQPPVYFAREPGGTLLAERVRELLLDPEMEINPWTEAYLYAAARADLVRREISPRLETGLTVVCDRFLDSSLAYQGAGRNLGIEAVRGLNAPAVTGLAPDLTFYLRLDEAERLRRAREIGAPPDRIERMGSGFMRRVEGGFEDLARLEPHRIKVLDASLPPRELAETARAEVEDLRLSRGGVS